MINMTTYSEIKEFVYRSKSTVIPKQNEDQLRTYDSVIERRAWSLDKHEQRRYMLQCVHAPQMVREAIHKIFINSFAEHFYNSVIN